jgi:hypothetical protein
MRMHFETAPFGVAESTRIQTILSSLAVSRSLFNYDGLHGYHYTCIDHLFVKEQPKVNFYSALLIIKQGTSVLAVWIRAAASTAAFRHIKDLVHRTVTVIVVSIVISYIILSDVIDTPTFRTCPLAA